MIEKYRNPQIEIVLFGARDIITNSTEELPAFTTDDFTEEVPTSF